MLLKEWPGIVPDETETDEQMKERESDQGATSFSARHQPTYFKSKEIYRQAGVTTDFAIASAIPSEPFRSSVR